jgi:hypothetical protein
MRTEETGAGGDCLFHALAKAIKNWSGTHVTYQNIREELSNCINPTNVRLFIQQVREDHASHVPGGALDLNQVRFSDEPEHAVNKMKTIIRMPGRHFQGTDVCVAMLVKESGYFTKEGGVGVIMMNSHGPGFTRIEPNPTTDPRGTYLCVYAIGNMHWQLAFVDWENNAGSMQCFASAGQMLSCLHLL